MEDSEKRRHRERKDRNRDRDRDREWERRRCEREKSSVSDREKEREKEKRRERKDRERAKEREKERERGRQKREHGKRTRERDREREREREREKKSSEREKRREYDSDDSREERERHRQRRRSERDDEDDDYYDKERESKSTREESPAQIATIPVGSKGANNTLVPNQLPCNVMLPVSLPATPPSVRGTATTVPGSGLPVLPNQEATRKAFQAALNLQHNLAKIQAAAMPERYKVELEINEFPQKARWKVTNKETLGPISDWTGAAITTRGRYFPPGQIPGPGERKLYLFIEGPSATSVNTAKAELKRVLEEYSHQALQLPGRTQHGRYQVL